MNTINKIIGTLLDPQPVGRNQVFLEACSFEKNKVGFYEGNSIDGHYLVFGPIEIPNPNLFPVQNITTKQWTWEIARGKQ